MLRSHRNNVFIKKFNKRVQGSPELLTQYASQIRNVAWDEYIEVLAPHNGTEEALNMFYLCRHATVASYRVEEKDPKLERFRFSTTPLEEDVPEIAKCKRGLKLFLSRLLQVYKSTRVQQAGAQSSKEVKRYSESNAQLFCEQLRNVAARCQKHLQNFDAACLVPGPDFDISQVLSLQLAIMHAFNELSQELNKGYSVNRQVIATHCINKLLELDMIAPILQIIEWAVKTLKTIDSTGAQPKLLLLSHLLGTCAMTPTLFVS